MGIWKRVVRRSLADEPTVGNGLFLNISFHLASLMQTCPTSRQLLRNHAMNFNNDLNCHNSFEVKKMGSIKSRRLLSIVSIMH